MRICAYCWLPNHWHFVAWPEHDGDLSRFMQRMTNMHTQRWQRAKCRSAICFAICFVVSVSLSGCGTTMVPHVLAHRSPEVLCNQLVKHGKVQRDVYLELMAPPQRDEKMLAFLAGWGRRGPKYDAVVVEVIGRPDYMDAVLLGALQARLREEPTLLAQYALRQYDHTPCHDDGASSAGRNGDFSAIDLDNGHKLTELGYPIKKDSAWIMELAYQSDFVTGTAPESPGAKICALVDIAATFDRPELILSLTMDSLDEQWAKERAWLRENARYAYLANDKGIYKIDEESSRRGQPVAPELQLRPARRRGGVGESAGQNRQGVADERAVR